MNFEVGKKYWYINNGCYIIYQGFHNGVYKFEDFGDRTYYLTPEMIRLWVREV